MPESNRERAIAYALLPFLTPARIRQLTDHFHSLDAVADCPATTIAMLLNIPAAAADLVKHPLQDANILNKVRELAGSTLTIFDPGYPELLSHIVDPPPALFVCGSREALGVPSIAIVGSRNATAYGRSAAGMLARGLAEQGISVVSGMARGIDAAAHLGALAGGGVTVAVLGTGIDLVYPRNHANLAGQIAASGALVTELPPGTPPLPSNFPMRNRLIAGLTLGTIVVEATGRSGSLITARLAAEEGREVFAVPGPIFHPTSEGPHRLIQYGAKLLHDLDDVFDELPTLGKARGVARTTRPLPPELQEMLPLFDFSESIHPDSIRIRTGMEASTLAERLLRLEMEGAVKVVPGGRYVRIPPGG